MSAPKMIHTRTSRGQSGLLLFTICGLYWLLAGCRPDGGAAVEPTPTGNAGCRITSRAITYTSSPVEQRASWTYRSDGSLASYNNPSATSPHPTQVNYTYDAAGYLTVMVRHDVIVGIVGMIYDSTRTQYRYENGRLSQEIGEHNERVNYEYDQAGQLAKVTRDRGSYADKEIDIYTAGLQIDHVTIRYTDGKEVHPYEFSNGRVVRSYSNDRNYYTNYEYDVQGRLTKQEQTRNGNATQAFTYEYTDGKSYLEAQPLPKGWPEVTRKQVNYDQQPTGLVSRKVRYLPPLFSNVGLYQNMVTDYTYIKNAQGYPIRCEYATTIYAATGGGTVGTPSRIVETYSYAGCPD